MDALSLNSGLTIRPICAADAPRLGRLLERCSARTTYHRYFTPIRRPRPWTLADQANLDHNRREAVVAAGADEIVGMAQCDRLAGGDSVADVAVLVEDAWQRRGLGTVLLTRISVLAADRGVRQFTAAVLSSNVAALGLLHQLFAQVDVREQGYSCDIRIACGVGRAVSPGAQLDRGAIGSTTSMSAALPAGTATAATSPMYSSGVPSPMPPVVPDTSAWSGPMSPSGPMGPVSEPALVGLAVAARVRGQTPAVRYFRCGHQLAQHAPAAARYCRVATWEPAFDPAALLAVPPPRAAQA